VPNTVAAGFLLAIAAGCAVPNTAIRESGATITAMEPAECSAQLSEEASGTGLSFERFGVELLAATSKDGERNALVSPLSAGITLAMLAEWEQVPDSGRRSIWDLLYAAGAGQEVEEPASGEAGAPATDDESVPAPDEMDAAGGGVPEGGNAHGEGLREALLCRLAAIAADAAGDDGIELGVANGAFPSRAVDFSDLEAVLADRFGAHVETLDFHAAADATRRINAWAAQATDDAIPNLLATLPTDTILVLANTVLFHGEWSQPFDPDRTAALPFLTGAGSRVEAATMRADDLSARFREDESFQALSLPYGDGRFGLMIVLPSADLAAADALHRLASDPTWLSGQGYVPARGHLSLPRATVQGTYELLPILHALGLSNEVSVSQVVQSTMLELDEKGTEAAAATAAVVSKSLTRERAGFDMRVDRPFALALRHLDSGAFLFAAWVDDPSQ